MFLGQIQQYFTLEDLKWNKIIEMTYKSVDFKSSAVQHCLENNKSMDNVCHIFGCAQSSLKNGLIDIRKRRIYKESRLRIRSIKNI